MISAKKLCPTSHVLAHLDSYWTGKTKCLITSEFLKWQNDAFPHSCIYKIEKYRKLGCKNLHGFQQGQAPGRHLELSVGSCSGGCKFSMSHVPALQMAEVRVLHGLSGHVAEPKHSCAYFSPHTSRCPGICCCGYVRTARRCPHWLMVCNQTGKLSNRPLFCKHFNIWVFSGVTRGRKALEGIVFFFNLGEF